MGGGHRLTRPLGIGSLRLPSPNAPSSGDYSNPGAAPPQVGCSTHWELVLRAPILRHSSRAGEGGRTNPAAC